MSCLCVCLCMQFMNFQLKWQWRWNDCWCGCGCVWVWVSAIQCNFDKHFERFAYNTLCNCLIQIRLELDATISRMSLSLSLSTVVLFFPLFHHKFHLVLLSFDFFCFINIFIFNTSIIWIIIVDIAKRTNAITEKNSSNSVCVRVRIETL